MTTQTRALPDLDESLDWDPACVVGHHDQSDYEPCSQPAAWLSVRRCCGRASFWCESHYAIFMDGCGNRRCAYCKSVPVAYSRIERIK